MARPWRIEYTGALYHVLSRGNQQQDIFLQDEDRRSFLKDMLIYLLWQTGKFINSEIGEQFGLTYSSVTRRVDAFKNRWEKEEGLKRKYEKFKSQIKV